MYTWKIAKSRSKTEHNGIKLKYILILEYVLDMCPKSYCHENTTDIIKI